ncbi:MAG TPA: 50S ribosomal protein L9 [Phycisphaerales bacterium]|nr:50S ribosomal protein L9 [Phycisphaerales bacterium]
MAKNVSLLLIENVENVGIVGDVVNVRVGYARNFLLPRSLATKPSDDLVKQLAAKRADAEKLVAAQRKEREAMSEKLKGVEVDIIRSCNDMGILYGAVTQQDIAAALVAKGFKVTGRDVRMSQTIKRIENADVHVKLAKDLDAVVKVHVKPDRELPKDVGGASAADAPAEQAGAGGGEGKGKRRDALSMALEAANKPAEKGGWGTDKKVVAEAAAEAKADKAKKADKADKGEAKAEKAEKPAKAEKKK